MKAVNHRAKIKGVEVSREAIFSKWIYARKGGGERGGRREEGRERGHSEQVTQR